jgi:hypothetical protein
MGATECAGIVEAGRHSECDSDTNTDTYCDPNADANGNTDGYTNTNARSNSDTDTHSNAHKWFAIKTFDRVLA